MENATFFTLSARHLQVFQFIFSFESHQQRTTWPLGPRFKCCSAIFLLHTFKSHGYIAIVRHDAKLLLQLQRKWGKKCLWYIEKFDLFHRFTCTAMYSKEQRNVLHYRVGLSERNLSGLLLLFICKLVEALRNTN